MLDILPIAGMLFSLLMALIIGGFVLVFPLTRRLGRLLELRMQERQEGASLPKEELAQLQRTVEALQDELVRLAERQQFTERLLERPAEPRVPTAPE